MGLFGLRFFLSSCKLIVLNHIGCKHRKKFWKFVPISCKYINNGDFESFIESSANLTNCRIDFDKYTETFIALKGENFGAAGLKHDYRLCIYI